MNMELFSFLFLYSLATAATEDTNQIVTKDLIGWIVNLLAVVVAAIALIYTAKEIKYESNAKFVESFKTIEEDLTKIENDPAKKLAAGSLGRLNWEVGLLNNVERLAWLLKSGKYPKEFKDYYKNTFSGVLYLLENSQQSKKDDCKEIIEICTCKCWTSKDIY
jgi:hypothetical protein